MREYSQLPLFEVSDASHIGWHPAELVAGTQVHWAEPHEMDARLDASYYVIARRRERLLDALRCPLAPLESWAEVNPGSQRLHQERGYWLFDTCYYAEIRRVMDGCWLLGPGLPEKDVRSLSVRATYRSEPGDLLLPRVASSLHRTVRVVDVERPLVVSSAFALLSPCSEEAGLVLLALLHHRVLGEQLWALASGTTVRSVAAGKVSALRVPELAPGLHDAIAERVRDMLRAQEKAFYPERALVLRDYWQDGTLAQWRSRARRMAAEIETMIDEALAW
jgi:hypothetical protein